MMHNKACLERFQQALFVFTCFYIRVIYHHLSYLPLKYRQELGHNRQLWQ